MIRVLLTYALLVLRVLPALFRSQSEQAIVELVLRQQLATYAGNRSRPRLTRIDRAFWVSPIRDVVAVEEIGRASGRERV